MNKPSLLHAAVLQAAVLSLVLGVAAARASDFDYGHPDAAAVQQAREQATAPAASATVQQVVITAKALSQQPRMRITTEESRAVMSEDAGLLRMSQRVFQRVTQRVTQRVFQRVSQRDGVPMAGLEATPR